ncbi:hypothetical protein [Bacillus salipaludis]|uniref:hypothetical protein n=1 Tax=Bacillus salipaludis TaxID=2547811 RepID=UPI001F3FD294|nr:hypothetical protein [Bacillus salipaludis]
MKFLAFSIIFVIFYGIFDWLINKTNFHHKIFDNKLLGKPRKYKFKFTRTVLILIIALFTFILELEKGSLNEKYGKFNYISIIIGAFLSSIYVNFAPLIFSRNPSLRKDNLKGIAKLMYQDVSDDPWDKENLTKENLDFTIGSIRFIDMYSKRLMNTKILNEHKDNFVRRIGAYIGEVIKRKINQDFNWYEIDSVKEYSVNFAGLDSRENQSVLYSQKRDIVISPLSEVFQFLEGHSPYTNLQTYVEEMIKNNSLIQN